MVWVDRNGTEQPIAAPPRRYQSVAVSRDGRHIATGIFEGTAILPQPDVWVYDVARGALSRITFDRTSSFPVWTADGSRVLFLDLSRREQRLEIRAATTGGTQVTTVLKLESVLAPTSLAPDGTLAGNVQRAGGTNARDTIGFARVTDGASGSARLQGLVDSPFVLTDPRFSPDGRFVAYESTESGRGEIFVMSYPDQRGKWQVSVDGGVMPRWAASGNELFFRNGDKLMAVDVEVSHGFRAGTPRMLFDKRYRAFAYDVSPDGRRFLMLKNAVGQDDTPDELHVVINWAEELRRRVPLPD